MDYPYTIEDLASMCQVSKQSIYSLIKKNDDFIKNNSIRQGKKIKYSQDALNLFLDYYGIKLEDEPTPEDPENEIVPEIAPQEGKEPSATSPKENDPEERIKALESEIVALKNEIATLKEDNRELVKQNGQVLLLLQEEKTEKMKLLPAPKESFLKKVSNFFRK